MGLGWSRVHSLRLLQIIDNFFKFIQNSKMNYKILFVLAGLLSLSAATIRIPGIRLPGAAKEPQAPPQPALPEIGQQYTVNVHFIPALHREPCAIGLMWDPPSLECGRCVCFAPMLSRCFPRSGCSPSSTTLRPPVTSTGTSSSSSSSQAPPVPGPQEPQNPQNPQPPQQGPQQPPSSSTEPSEPSEPNTDTSTESSVLVPDTPNRIYIG